MAEIGRKFLEENPTATLSPTYRIDINGKEVEEGIYRCLLEAVYESSEDMIDKLELKFNNPKSKLSEMKMFLPGNEISIWVGYKGQVQFLGRGVIYHNKVFFPNNELSTMELKAYPKSFQMTEKRPVIKKKGDRSVKKKDPTVWKKSSLDLVFKDIASKLGFKDDCDPCPIKNPVNQPKHMSYYDFCSRLSNLADYYFWVDGDEKGRWILHFKNPQSVKREQSDIYTFYYNSGEKTTLFEFEPEIVLTKQYAKVYTETVLPNGKTLKATFEENQKNKWDIKSDDPEEEIQKPFDSPNKVKVYLDDISFFIPQISSLKTDKDLQNYVDLWIKRNSEEFMMGNGKLIGIPNLRARQNHKLEGLGKIYDGSWHFTRVKHIINESNGYSCEFDARRNF